MSDQDQHHQDQHHSLTYRSQIQWAAKNRKLGMTLDEMIKFVQQATRLNMDGDAVLRIDAGWRGQIQMITAENQQMSRADSDGV